jgi:type VI secretion system protein ImpJ
MAVERRQANRSLVDYASHEVASFWLLHTVHSSLSPLRHALLERTVHPEEAYLELSRLAGALCTFALDADPRALPLYDHENLGFSFGQLEQRIRARLEVVIPTSYVRVVLEPRSLEGVAMIAGPVVDERCFGRARWILGVRSSLTMGALISTVPRMVKVCAASAIPWLVRRAHPGLELDHITMPPAAIAPRSDTQYFGIHQSGPCRDLLVASKEIGVYVPDSVPDAEVDVLVVLES